jgi:NADPH:quinone reductase-like Zn-dependent oxidoreductase
MQAIQVCAVSRDPGTSSLLTRTSDVPPPPAGHARVQVEAAGVSYGDLLFQRGVVPGGPKPPYIPGCDLTGVVESVGAGVTEVEPGQRVAALVVSGGHSSVVNVLARRLVVVPDGVDPVQVASVALNYFIAYQMLHRVVGARSGQRILVHGASGGVGLAFLQLAGHIGGVASWGTCSAGNMDLVRRNGAVPIDYRSEDFVSVIRAAGGGLHAVYDHIGGLHFRRSYRLLQRGGYLVAYSQNAALRNGRRNMLIGAVGFLGGIAAPKLIPDGKITLFYNAWALEKTQPSAYREDLSQVLALMSADKIAPRSVVVLPLREAGNAFQALAEGVSGKIVLSCVQD